MDNIKSHESKKIRRRIRAENVKLRKRTYLDNSRQNIFGFPNLGNTCYLNSALQIIIRNPFLKEIFDRLRNTIFSKDNNNKQISIGNILINLLELVYVDNMKKYKLFSLQNRKAKLIAQIIKILKINNHNYNTEISYDSVIFYRDFLNHLTNDESIDKFFISKLKSIFYGKMENSFHCPHCDFVEKISENFIDLNCPTGDTYSASSINSLITKYFSDEILENLSCENCNETVNITIKKQMTKIPHTLAISTNLKCISDSDNEIQIKNINFKLMGVILYDEEKGHCISKVRCNEKFYFFNDKIVNDLIDEFTYKIVMLIYTAI